MLAYQIFRPLAYLTIRDPSKWKFDYLIPGIMGLLTSVVFHHLFPRPPVFASDGILSQLYGLLEILPGFYLTALAAIATFNRLDMDRHLPRPTPTIRVRIKGQSLAVELTRRRMLSLLFGHLTAISMFLFIVSIASNFMAPALSAHIPAPAHWMVLDLFALTYACIFWHMIMVTMFGLYQLSDRMHQPDQEDAL